MNGLRDGQEIARSRLLLLETANLPHSLQGTGLVGSNQPVERDLCIIGPNFTLGLFRFPASALNGRNATDSGVTAMTRSERVLITEPEEVT